MRQVGNLIVYESPDSPQWKFGELDSCVRTFTGPYADLFSMRPARGDTMEGTGENMKVQDSTLKRSKLGQGVLTVNMIGVNPGTGSTPGEDPISTVVEIDWVAVQKDLRTHPIFSDTGAHPVTEEGWAKIEKWKNEPDHKLRMGFGGREVPAEVPYAFTSGDGTTISLTQDEMFAANKILKGVEGYNLYAPVVRKTSTYNFQPGCGSAGFRQEPVVAYTTPDGYHWLKTACRVVLQQDKSWQLFEEWTGADEWDTDLYPETPPEGAASKTAKVETPQSKISP